MLTLNTIFQYVVCLAVVCNTNQDYQRIQEWPVHAFFTAFCLPKKIMFISVRCIGEMRSSSISRYYWIKRSKKIHIVGWLHAKSIRGHAFGFPYNFAVIQRGPHNTFCELVQNVTTLKRILMGIPSADTACSQFQLQLMFARTRTKSTFYFFVASFYYFLIVFCS